MKKILILTLISLVLSLPSSARRVKGNVECEGRCLSGVIVTDGCNFTTTRKDGSFVLNAGRDARFIYIVTPSGYTPDYSTGAPQFYLPLEGTGKFCFSLSKTTEQEDFTIFSVSDPQMGNKKHLARFSGKPLGDLRGLARKYSEVRPTVGIALGDIAWNDTKMFADYKSVILTTNIPFYSVIGNHDYIQDQDGPAAAKAFEDAFGPCNWAFFLGNDLIVGLNNIKFAASGKEKPTLSSYNYSSGYTAEAISFLRGLMKYAGKGSHIFIAQHSPIKRESGALIEGIILDVVHQWERQDGQCRTARKNTGSNRPRRWEPDVGKVPAISKSPGSHGTNSRKIYQGQCRAAVKQFRGNFCHCWK